MASASKHPVATNHTAILNCVSQLPFGCAPPSLQSYAHQIRELPLSAPSKSGVCASSVFKETHRKSDPHTPKRRNSFRPFIVICSLCRNFFGNSRLVGRSGVSAKQDLSTKTPRTAPMPSQMPCAASAGIGNPRHKATPAMPFRAGFGGKIVEGWIIPFVASLLVFDGVSYKFCECVYAWRLSFHRASHQRLAETMSKHQNSTSSRIACRDHRIEVAKEAKIWCVVNLDFQS